MNFHHNSRNKLIIYYRFSFAENDNTFSEITLHKMNKYFKDKSHCIKRVSLTYGKVNVGCRVRLPCSSFPKYHETKDQRECYPCHGCNEMMANSQLFLLLCFRLL